MTYRGATGEIRWAYATAVVFGPWRLELDQPGSGTLTGNVVSVDEYRAAQTPLRVVLTVGRGRLIYPVVEMVLSGPTITATVGPRVQE